MPDADVDLPPGVTEESVDDPPTTEENLEYWTNELGLGMDDIISNPTKKAIQRMRVALEEIDSLLDEQNDD
jgi:hypothetical protein